MNDTVIAYDLKQRKIGCVLLQAVMGGDPVVAQKIPNEDWIFTPSPNLKLYRITGVQAEELVAYHRTKRREQLHPQKVR